MSFTYSVRESLHFYAIQQLFGECLLHIFDNKNIGYTGLMFEIAKKFTNNLRLVLGSKSNTTKNIEAQ